MFLTMQCQAITKKGTQCRRVSKIGRGKCQQHSSSARKIYSGDIPQNRNSTQPAPTPSIEELSVLDPSYKPPQETQPPEETDRSKGPSISTTVPVVYNNTYVFTIHITPLDTIAYLQGAIERKLGLNPGSTILMEYYPPMRLERPNPYEPLCLLKGGMERFRKGFTLETKMDSSTLGPAPV